MGEAFNELYCFNDELISTLSFESSSLVTGKSIYEVIRIIDGIPLFMELHLDRLINSSNLANRNIWLTKQEIINKIKMLIFSNKVIQGNIKIVFNFNEKTGNNFYAYFLKHNYPTKEEYENGVAVIFYHGERENPNAKVMDQNFRNRVEESLKLNNAYEAILVDEKGNITEGSKSNIFLVKGDRVFTSPREDVLPGITREMIIDLCMENQIPVIEEKLNYRDIREFDGLFISGTSPKVLPIKKVNEEIFNSAENLLIKKISRIYDEKIDMYIREHL